MLQTYLIDFIEDNNNLEIIYNLHKNNILNNIPPILYRHIAIYFWINKNYEEMKKYYLMAIEMGDLNAMFNLGLYYKKIENYEEMKKYYLMAIEKGESIAMNNLGQYYQFIEKKYDEAIKYYEMNNETFKEKLNTLLKDNFIHNIAHKYKHLLTGNNLKKYAEFLNFHKCMINDNKEECCICMEDTYLIELNCHPNHKICYKCIKNIVRCPLCRENI